MQIKNLLILIAAFWTLQHADAQNIHFSQFNMSPQTLNPALTGAFQGTFRINGIYREQYRSAMSSGSDRFTTPSISVDANIMRGLRKKDWISGGIMVFTDKAGATGLSQNAFKLAAAYHLALDKKGTTVLALGAHWGVVGTSLQGGAWRFADELISGTPSDDRTSLGIQQDNGDAKKSGKDLDAGLLLSGKLNKQMDYNLGFSMFHLFTPQYSLLSNTGGSNPGPNPTPTPSTNSAQDRPLRTTLHGQFNIQLSKSMTFSPSFAFQTTRGLDEIILQAMGGYKLDPKKEFTLTYGLGYRFREGFHPMIGMKQKDLQVGLAYDINTNGLNSVTGYRGGFELAASYIFRIHKPAVIKPQVLCPRF
jgi:type IX secretion system PorP/SprF family membrane protein